MNGIQFQTLSSHSCQPCLSYMLIYTFMTQVCFIYLRLWTQDFIFVTLITFPVSHWKKNCYPSDLSAQKSESHIPDLKAIWHLHVAPLNVKPLFKKYKIPKQTMKCIRKDLVVFLLRKSMHVPKAINHELNNYCTSPCSSNRMLPI